MGAWSDCSRQTTVAEEAVNNWCKVQDALGEVFMSQYRTDCLQYMKQWNADNQILLSEQSMLDLFMGGISTSPTSSTRTTNSPRSRRRSRASVVLSGKAALLCRRRYWSASESVSSTDRRTGTPQYNHFQRCAHPACDLRTKTPLARLRPRTAMAATAAGSSTSTCRRHTRRS